jgi:SNF2 family DNA or RNA helicase
MSGTPFRSDLTKAWGTLNWLRPDVFTSFWNFAKTHFDVEQGDYSLEVGKEPVDQAAFDAALRPYFLARDKQTAAPDLPPITYAGTPLPGEPDDSPCYVQIDMEPEQAKAYKAMRLDAIATIEGGRVSAVGILAEITRLRQFALSYGRMAEADDKGAARYEPSLPSAKFDWILEFLTERKGNAGKVVIASSFTSWIKVLSTELSRAGFRNMTLTGETGDADREKLVRRFADPDDEARVAIINTKAGGVGITLDAADDMIITDLPWKSDDERQVTDRIHRVSRIHNVTVYRLLSAGTVDIWMAGLNDEQRRILAGGGEDARAMAEGALK